MLFDRIYYARLEIYINERPGETLDLMVLSNDLDKIRYHLNYYKAYRNIGQLDIEYIRESKYTKIKVIPKHSENAKKTNLQGNLFK